MLLGETLERRGVESTNGVQYVSRTTESRRDAQEGLPGEIQLPCPVHARMAGENLLDERGPRAPATQREPGAPACQTRFLGGGGRGGRGGRRSADGRRRGAGGARTPLDAGGAGARRRWPGVRGGRRRGGPRAGQKPPPGPPIA